MYLDIGPSFYLEHARLGLGPSPSMGVDRLLPLESLLCKVEQGLGGEVVKDPIGAGAQGQGRGLPVGGWLAGESVWTRASSSSLAAYLGLAVSAWRMSKVSPATPPTLHSPTLVQASRAQDYIY